MKNFNDLSKTELSTLTGEQVDAYVDVELAAQGVIIKKDIRIDFPSFVSKVDKYPERDRIVYECDGKTFQDHDEAARYSDFVSTLHQVDTGYDWNVDSSERFVKGVSERLTPAILEKRMYSAAKFEAIKSTLLNIKKQKEASSKKSDEEVESVIDYNKVEEASYKIRSKVRDAIRFFGEAKETAQSYFKYLTITNDKEKAIETVFMVNGIQDEEMRTQIRTDIDQLIAAYTDNK